MFLIMKIKISIVSWKKYLNCLTMQIKEKTWNEKCYADFVKYACFLYGIIISLGKILLIKVYFKSIFLTQN